MQELEETLDLLAIPGALDQIRQAEADIAAGNVINADEPRQQMSARADREQRD